MKRNSLVKRILALVLSTVMVMNGGISVFAEEVQPETEIVVSIPEPETSVTITEETFVDEEGNITLKTVTITEGKSVNSEYYEEENLSIIKDADGKFIEESGVVEGSQTSVSEIEADVSIKFEEIKEGATAMGASEGNETVLGDLKGNETDPEPIMSDVPKTGSIASTYLAVAAISGLGLTVLAVNAKPGKEDEE